MVDMKANSPSNHACTHTHTHKHTYTHTTTLAKIPERIVLSISRALIALELPCSRLLSRCFCFPVSLALFSPPLCFCGFPKDCYMMLCTSTGPSSFPPSSSLHNTLTLSPLCAYFCQFTLFQFILFMLPLFLSSCYFYFFCLLYYGSINLSVSLLFFVVLSFLFSCQV